MYWSKAPIILFVVSIVTTLILQMREVDRENSSLAELTQWEEGRDKLHIQARGAQAQALHCAAVC